MATEQYTAPNIALTKLIPAINSADGAVLKVLTATYAKTAADNDGSILRFFKGVDPNLIPVMGMLANAAIAGLTSVSLGIWKTGIGSPTYVNNAFLSAANIAAGAVSINPKTAFDAFLAVPLVDQGQKRLFEFAGHTVANKQGEYDIALLMATAGVNTGQITIALVFAQG